MPRPTDQPPETSPSRRWLADWERRIVCSTPAFETVTTDPFTVQELIQEGARRRGRPLITWDVARGFDCKSPGVDQRQFTAALDALAGTLNPSGFSDPMAVLHAVRSLPVDQFARGHHAVFALVNFYPYFDTDDVRQEFEDLVKYYELVGEARLRPIHFIQAPYAKLGLRGIEAVRHHMEPMPLPLPDAAELLAGPVANLLAVVREEDRESGGARPESDYSDAHLTAIASACVGLSRPRATAQLFYAAARKDGLISTPTVDRLGEPLPPLVSLLSDIVAAELASGGLLEIVADGDIVPPEDLAGVEKAVAGLERAAVKFTPEAEAQHLDPARGHWYCGLEGSGKSALAFAAAEIFRRRTGRHWKVILVKMPAMYGGLYGETESNWYEFEERISAFGECICVFDEAEKVFGGVMNSGSGSKVEQSLFGLWLSWMGSKAKRGRVFPIVCMNDPTGIPREALRAGRLDAGFFFALPDAGTRTAIAKIHFARRLRPLGLTLDALGWTETQWTMLGEAAVDYLPGEIETLVAEARDLAFDPSEVRLPTYNQVMALVDDRRREIEDDPDAREDHQKRVAAMGALKKKCRSMGARPVHVSTDPAPDPKLPAAGRGRVRQPRPDNN